MKTGSEGGQTEGVSVEGNESNEKWGGFKGIPVVFSDTIDRRAPRVECLLFFVHLLW